jgi:hypothetical protein
LEKRTAIYAREEEQSSYFPTAIALGEKIISSGPEALIWSTDHVDNNKLAEVLPPLLDTWAVTAAVIFIVLVVAGIFPRVPW